MTLESTLSTVILSHLDMGVKKKVLYICFITLACHVTVYYDHISTALKDSCH